MKNPARLMISFFLILLLINCGKKETPQPTTSSVTKPSPPRGIVTNIGPSLVPYVVVKTDGVIVDEPKLSGTLHVLQNGNWIHNEFIGIEHRGKTSQRLTNKKSFGVETWDEQGGDLDVSLFDMPEEEDWILQGHVIGEDWDNSLMHHYIAYELYRNMGNYASRTEFVELEVNDEYMGIYVFMEKLKRDNDRIDVSNLDSSDEDVTGGYILKIDKAPGPDWVDDATYTSLNSFRSDYDVDGNILTNAPYAHPEQGLLNMETYFLYEDPKAEEITTSQKSYIQNFIKDFESSLLTDDFSGSTRSYTDYIDLNSFVDIFIINELCRNVDGYRLSTVLYKDRGGKMHIGPPWDFNIGFAKGGRVDLDRWVIEYNDIVSYNDWWLMPFWWPRLMEDPIFRTAVKARWLELRTGALGTSTIHNLVDNTADYLRDNGAVQRNVDKWGDYNFDGAVIDLKTFISDRSSWMDGEIANF